MKTTLICLIAAITAGCAKIEEVKYQVIEKHGNIEIRKYQPHIAAATTVQSTFEDAGNQGFRRLFGYISGNNKTKTKINMTAPVNQKNASEKIEMTAPVGQKQTQDGWQITFIMPQKYSIQDVPEPNDKKIQIIQIDGFRAAVIKYSGNWSKDKYQKQLEKLEKFVAQKNLKAAAEPIFARYNPPFMPPIFRRNEIVMSIE